MHPQNDGRLLVLVQNRGFFQARIAALSQPWSLSIFWTNKLHNPGAYPSFPELRPGEGNSSNFAANNQSISNLPCWCFCVVRFQAHRCIQFLTRISLMQPVHWQNATFHYLDRAAVQPALPWTYRHPFLFYVCLPL